MLMMPTFAFIIKGPMPLEYEYNGKICIRTPWEESILRGYEAPYAQLTGRIYDINNAPSTITLIAPNLAISCAHSAKGFDNHGSLLTKWVSNNKQATRAYLELNNQRYESSIESFYLPPGYNSESRNTISRANDISIIKLAENIAVNSFLPFYTDSETSITAEAFNSAVCVSSNQIHTHLKQDNSPYYRHVTTPQITYNPDTLNFREEFFVPCYYKSVPVESDRYGWLPYPSSFKPKTPAPSGLQGPVTPGDSGSPLMIFYKDNYHLLGITTHVQREPAYNRKTKQYRAGQSFYNGWASLPYNLAWIKKILEQENALSYHPELLAIDS